ncbi:MAG: LPS export ABC transporter periplasmic protein LptC [Gammaproteobacteria bacterium]|nr:LPS export ABC transporter periplasmic protein LptC [Gammaproteobacteria bacterium]MDE2344842.1 LPS export ABC transporter periplasmic protein LptC [Gammaproteobacteria bacterium]
MNLRIWLLVIILALSAAGTWWLLRHVTPPVIQKSPPVSHAPDYYFTDATVTMLNEEGKPKAIMTALRILHHPDNDSVEVFTPRVEYFVAGEQPWHLQADHALMPAGGKLVELNGHVVIRHAGNRDGQPLVIHTDQMNLYLNTYIATSAAPVEITQGTSRMSGVGMHANLKENRLQLETEARGYYVQKK